MGDILHPMILLSNTARMAPDLRSIYAFHRVVFLYLTLVITMLKLLPTQREP
jgi:hypothetical protein